MVLIPIFLKSKLRLAQALQGACGRVMVGGCSVQRPCPFQPSGQQPWESSRRVTQEKLSLGWFSSSPHLTAEATSDPWMRVEGENGLGSEYCALLSGKSPSTYDPNSTWLNNKFNLPSPQQKSDSKTRCGNRQSHNAEGLRTLRSFPSQLRAPRPSSFPSFRKPPLSPCSRTGKHVFCSACVLCRGLHACSPQEVQESVAHRRALEKSVLKE